MKKLNRYYRIKIRCYIKWLFVIIGSIFVLIPPKDPLIDERIFGVLLVWMAIDIARGCGK